MKSASKGPSQKSFAADDDRYFPGYVADLPTRNTSSGRRLPDTACIYQQAIFGEKNQGGMHE